IGRVVSFFAQNQITQIFGGLLLLLFIFTRTKDGGKRLFKTNKADDILVALGGIRAALKDGDCGFHPGIFEPRLIYAFDYRNETKILKNPMLEGKTIADIKPA